MPDQPQTTIREPGFYRLRWNNGRMAIGYLHARAEPAPWSLHPKEWWSVFFIHDAPMGTSAAYTMANAVPEADIGERIEWTK